jgi:hypothetical protein|tara:strand:+ start:107 stop:421 length:315 start_codon:yes stop_codon:yes gene_type:complete
MADLSSKVRMYVGTEIKFGVDVLIQNDGQGDYIKEWNLDTAQPTQAQLDALETQADDYEFNLGQIAKRKAEYGTAESQMENIIENGLEAEQTRIQSIKDKYPKR